MKEDAPTHAYCVSLPSHTGSAARHIGHESCRSSHSETHFVWNTCLAEHGMRVAWWPSSNASRHTAQSASSSAAAPAASSTDVRARNAEMASLAAAEARLPGGASDATSASPP